MPEPLLPIAIVAHAKTDEEQAVGRLAGWLPTRHCGSSKIKRPSGRAGVAGEAHAGVVLDTLANRYGVSVDTIELRRRCGNLSPAMRKALAATSNSPVVTVSTWGVRHRGGAAAGGFRFRVRQSGWRQGGSLSSVEKGVQVHDG